MEDLAHRLQMSNVDDEDQILSMIRKMTERRIRKMDIDEGNTQDTGPAEEEDKKDDIQNLHDSDSGNEEEENSEDEEEKVARRGKKGQLIGK